MSSLSSYLQYIKQTYPLHTNLGLERILTLLKRLGSPHLALPPTIHVAGTNGKGSTIAMLRAMLEAEGKKVHVYTSPHLIRFNERIVLAGCEIKDQYLIDLVERCRKEGVDGVTTFELTTAAAFIAFAEVKADYLLLETGLGGRLDATNVIQNPILTLITSLSIDHTEHLGNSIEGIAYEKAGILKTGCPLITTIHPFKAQEVISTQAQTLNCLTLQQEKEWKVLESRDSLKFKWKEDFFTFPLPTLLGQHQIQNSGLALAASFYLGLSPSSLATGLQKAFWPGRLQKLPSVEGVEMWLDGAHNPGGAQAILTALKRWQEKNRLPLYLIVGMIASKDHEAFLKVFCSHIEKIFIVPLESDYQHLDPYVLLKIARKFEFSVALAENLTAAVKQIYSQEVKKPCRVLICGSLYLVGEVLKNEFLVESNDNLV
jgi:dihydrofolate synthase/folylpolyglutamate synthase